MASKKTTFKGDIGIKNSSGTEVGFFLQKDKNGVPFYEELTSSAIGEQRVDGTPEYADFRAEEEIRLVSDNWSSGFGLEYEGYPTSGRYHYTTNIDARFSNEVILGSKATAVTLPTVTTLSITNADMELDSDWTGGARSGTQKHGGSYSWQVTMAANVSYQDIESGTDYKGRRYKILCWVYADQASHARIQLDDGVGTSESSYHTGGSTFEQLTVVHDVDASATRLRINLLNDGGVSNSCFFDDITLVQPTKGQVISQCDFNSERYAVSGNIVMKLDADGDEFTYVWNDADTTQITQIYPSNVAGVDYMFVMTGWDYDYWYMSTAEAFLQTDLTDAEIKYMVEIAGTFHGASANNVIRRTTAPLQGGTNWATNKTVGEDAYDIVSIVSFERLPYIKKSNGKVYYMDSSDDIQPLIEGVSEADGTDTAQMYVWREEALVIPYGEQGLLHYDGTTISHISPALYMNNASDFSGQVVAVDGDDMSLFIVMDDGADVQVLASKLGATPSDWGWHPISTQTLTGCASLGISSVYRKRAWVGSTSGSEDFKYIAVTNKYGDIANDSTITYQTGGILYTPGYHCNLRGDKKAWIKITIEQGHAYDANIYWECHYKKIGDSGWTDIGDFKGSATTKFTTKYLPVDGSSNNPVSQAMWFKIVGVTDDTAKTPILKSFDIQTVWYPAQRKIYHCKIVVGDNELTKQGTFDATRGETKKALLDELYNPTDPYPRQFYPLDYETNDTAIYIKALPPKSAKVISYEKRTPENRIEYLYDCYFEEVTIA